MKLAEDIMSEFRFPRHIVLAGAPFSAKPSENPEVRSFQEAFFILFDLATDGAVTKGGIKLHWFEDVDELLRELGSLQALAGNDPQSISFVLFSKPGAGAIQLQRKVISLELTHAYIPCTKVLVYGPYEWQSVSALARRSPESRSFILDHQRQSGVTGPALFALQARSAYDSGDFDGLREYLANRQERETEPPPPPPPSPRKERDDQTIQYPTPDRPSQLMRALPPEQDGRQSDPSAITMEIPTDVIQRAQKPK
ncbi:hypothetical protein IT407_00525 [Candidatus Uhrbacteria bacterium]|nr:hypothetical protein [Candidatus Uhrbacteria bacterium]